LTAGIALSVVVLVSRVDRAPARTLRIVSGSMEPTLAVGDLVRIDTSAYAASAPSIGDIVAFRAPVGATTDPPQCGAPQAYGEPCARVTPDESETIFVKRVVAGPGESVTIAGGSVVRDGTRAPEPFATPCVAAAVCNLPTAIEVPAGTYFLMGDNRERSDDSRSWGPVPRAWIIGKAIG